MADNCARRRVVVSRSAQVSSTRSSRRLGRSDIAIRVSFVNGSSSSSSSNSSNNVKEVS